MNDCGVRLKALKCFVSVSTAVTSFTDPDAGSVLIIVADVCGQGQGRRGQGRALEVKVTQREAGAVKTEPLQVETTELRA